MHKTQFGDFPYGSTTKLSELLNWIMQVTKDANRR